jgi:hypothetical protein
MGVADIQQVLAMFLAAETLQRIATVKRERVGLGKLIPQLFQLKSRLKVSFRPQQRDHFAKGHNARRFPLRCGVSLLDKVSDQGGEGASVRMPIAHELGESLSGVKRDVAANAGRGRWV